jgi:hypothetical protein
MLIFGEYLTVNINQVHIGKEMMVKILRPPTFSLFTKLKEPHVVFLGGLLDGEATHI